MADGSLGRVNYLTIDIFATVMDLTSSLAGPAGDFLGEILRVEPVHALDDRLHQLAGRRIVGVFGDRSDADASPAQHQLERDDVLALAGGAGESPDQALLERRVSLRGRGDGPRLPTVALLAARHGARRTGDALTGARRASHPGRTGARPDAGHLFALFNLAAELGLLHLLLPAIGRRSERAATRVRAASF